jgi:predicted transcriptional regulator
VPRGRSSNGKNGPILDLAPLERDCMQLLWPAGEATVRDIRDALAVTRPRAYTTIMTIMDRLAHKGVVERRKVGKAYVYRPNLSAEQARAHAVRQLVENFFEGSAEALAGYLTGAAPAARPAARPRREQPAQQESEPQAERRSAATEPAMDDTLL